jgi:hypothetical protein
MLPKPYGALQPRATPPSMPGPQASTHTHTATKLDQITIDLHQPWLNTTFTLTITSVSLLDSLNEQGFGFTYATHIKDTAFLASWQQLAPTILDKWANLTWPPS